MVVRRFMKSTLTISSIDDEYLANVQFQFQFLTFMRVETPEKIQSSTTIIAKKSNR